MSIKYGIKIGNVGVEFPSIDDRQKAIITFTKGSDVLISSSEIKYTPGEGNFSVYDRDTKDVITICYICRGEFLQSTCNKRTYPIKYNWNNDWSEETNYICDACYAKNVKDHELHQAKKLIGANND